MIVLKLILFVCMGVCLLVCVGTLFENYTLDIGHRIVLCLFSTTHWCGFVHSRTLFVGSFILLLTSGLCGNHTSQSYFTLSHIIGYSAFNNQG